MHPNSSFFGSLRHGTYAGLRHFIFSSLPLKTTGSALSSLHTNTAHVFTFAVALHFLAYCCSSGFSICFYNPSAIYSIPTKSSANTNPDTIYFPSAVTPCFAASTAIFCLFSVMLFYPFRTAVSFWGQTSQILSNLSPERDCGPKRVNDQFPSTSFWKRRGHRCLPFFPPGSCLCFWSRTGFSIPAVRRLSPDVANSRSPLALSATFFFMQEKAPTSMHSVRLEPTKLILIAARTTYQATGDAGPFRSNKIYLEQNRL